MLKIKLEVTTLYTISWLFFLEIILIINIHSGVLPKNFKISNS